MFKEVVVLALNKRAAGLWSALGGGLTAIVLPVTSVIMQDPLPSMTELVLASLMGSAVMSFMGAVFIAHTPPRASAFTRWGVGVATGMGLAVVFYVIGFAGGTHSADISMGLIGGLFGGYWWMRDMVPARPKPARRYEPPSWHPDSKF